MDCRDLQPLLADHALGLLDGATAAGVDAHLDAGCAPCRQEFDACLAAAAALVEAEPIATPRAGLRAEVLARLDAPAATVRVASSREAPRRWSGLALAASVALIAAGAWAVLQGDAPPAPTTIAIDPGADPVQSWRERLERFDRRFADAQPQTVGFDWQGGACAATTFALYDRSARQLHVWSIGDSADWRGRWAVLLDARGEVRASAPLRVAGDRAAAVLEMPAAAERPLVLVLAGGTAPDDLAAPGSVRGELRLP